MASRNEQVKVDFTKRETTGTGVCRKIRSKNMIPVILYGPEHKLGLPGTVTAKSITALANSSHKETTLVELHMSDGTVVSALIRDVQRHPLTQNIRHIDFYQVLTGHMIKVEIPIHIENKEACKGIKDGGVLNIGTRLLHVSIQPKDIPDQINLDITNLEIGAEIFVKDLPLPDGAELITDSETLVVHVLQPKSSSDDELTEETEREVEVVAKGKATKEEE